MDRAAAAAVSAEDLADAFLTQPEYDQSRMVKRAELLCEVYRKRTVRSQTRRILVTHE